MNFLPVWAPDDVQSPGEVLSAILNRYSTLPSSSSQNNFNSVSADPANVKYIEGHMVTENFSP